MLAFWFFHIFAHIIKGESMEESLNLDALLSDEQIAALTAGQEPEETKENKDTNNDFIDTDGLTAEDLFGNADQESVGASEEKEDNKEEKKPESTVTKDKSPDNLYSSIAEAMVDDGFFSDFKDEVKECKSAEDLLALVKKQVNSQLSETQARVKQALEDDVQPSMIQKAERLLKTLNGIDDERIEDESDEGASLRQSLIYNDYLSKGISEKKAAELTKRSFDDGTDKEDAKDALVSYTAKIKGEYNKLLSDARAEKQKELEAEEKKKADLKELILNKKEAFGEDVSNTTRQRMYDLVTKAYKKDSEDGSYLTEMQTYEKEHPVEFLANVAYYFAITDGFKSKDNITKAAERKATMAGLKKLEQVVNGTQRNWDGSLKLAGSRGDDSRFDGELSIDL